jgi:uncharacterized protein (TIGR01777 family)
MAYEQTHVIDSPLEEVFAWHARPGAIYRLMPPWQPVSVAQEASSLRDGTAVLAMPGPFKWVATHQGAEYDPPNRFVDVLTSPVLGRLIHWRHEHDFVGRPGQTDVIDRVTTTVPDRFIRQMFAYRSRQLTGDFAAHAWAAKFRGDPLNVAVTGSSGLVGSALCALLSTGGHRVIRLVRRPSDRVDTRVWNPEDPAPDLLDGVDAVVHLAGASIAGRFTAAHKRAIRESRIEPTRKLARLVGDRTFVVSSAIGYYGSDRGEEELTEEAGRGEGYLADVVVDWEEATGPALDSGARVVKVRTGIVQSPNGGALRLLRPLFSAGLGGRLGDGRQWTSWIGIDDLLDVYLRALVDSDLDGAINAVAPNPVRNSEYTKVLAQVLHRPALAPVPSFGPKLVLGSEGVTEVVMANQKVIPKRLADIGHPFRQAELDGALRHLLGRVALPSL